jgi:glucan 1,3-beta-glucosidase
MYGVNIGGWMVLERFITPLLLDRSIDENINDEYTLCLYKKNDSVIMEKLRNHWATWVQEEDVKMLAESGITHLRIPIGYWSLETQEELDQYGDPYLPGAWEYFERTVPLFKKYNLKMIPDLHGAPGSQNGWDNSGRICEPQWGTGDTINRTLKVIERLAQRLAALENNPATSGTVAGIELLNEAFPPRLKGSGIDIVKDYYLRAYPLVRKHLPADKYWVVIEQAFNTTTWTDFMSGPEYENVILDFHFYQVFSEGQRKWSADEHLSFACTVQREVLSHQTLPTIVGEWAIAWKEESSYAHLEPYPEEKDFEFITRFFLAQTHAWEEHGMGWYYWNFKTYNATMWDYLVGVRDNWFPHQPNNLVQDGCHIGGPRPVIPTPSAPAPTNNEPQNNPDESPNAVTSSALGSGDSKESFFIATLLALLSHFCFF